MPGLVFGLVVVAVYLLAGILICVTAGAVWFWLDDRREQHRPVAPLIPLDLGRERRRQARGRAR